MVKPVMLIFNQKNPTLMLHITCFALELTTDLLYNGIFFVNKKIIPPTLKKCHINVFCIFVVLNYMNIFLMNWRFEIFVIAIEL